MAAIQARLAGQEGMLTVLDIGTGPFALLAIAAARAGARKVYAIEVNSTVVQQARQAVEEAGFAETIEIFKGFSTGVTLPSKVDLIVSEIVGSAASEEGVYATIRDAHQRFALRPTDPASWIPHRIQTVAAPASWALHFGLGPPAYDWGGIKGPPRIFNVDANLQLLAEPALLEDISFADPDLPTAGIVRTPPVTFALTSGRMRANAKTYYDHFCAKGSDEEEAAELAEAVAGSFSGLAMWPRLVLDVAEEFVVESRGSAGEPRESSWQTLLPLVTERPIPVSAGDSVEVNLAVELREEVAKAPRYVLEGSYCAAGLAPDSD